MMTTVKIRLTEYIRLTRLDRPIGIYLVLWPMLWALWMAAEGPPDPLVLAVFLAGTVLMRSAGCAINDYADRHIDGHVARTRERPLARGAISPREAIGVFGVLSAISFALVLLMNSLTILLALAALGLAALYPFTKRYTHLPQAFLGIAFGWAIPMAFAAQTGAVPAASWLLFTAAVVWAIAYDTMYAMADRDDDLKIGVKSTAILFGRWDRFAIGVAQVLVLALLVLAGLEFGVGPVYFAGLALASAFSVYQQYLIRDRDAKRSFQAFLNNHYYGLVVFAGLALDYLIRS